VSIDDGSVVNMKSVAEMGAGVGQPCLPEQALAFRTSR
jgi:hypothetical protein